MTALPPPPPARPKKEGWWARAGREADEKIRRHGDTVIIRRRSGIYLKSAINAFMAKGYYVIGETRSTTGKTIVTMRRDPDPEFRRG